MASTSLAYKEQWYYRIKVGDHEREIQVSNADIVERAGQILASLVQEFGWHLKDHLEE